MTNNKADTQTFEYCFGQKHMKHAVWINRLHLATALQLTELRFLRMEDSRVGWDHRNGEKASSHWGDFRSLICEQSSPTREQRLSLQLRYYRLVGPSVWKCTCCRAGLWLRRDTGGGVDSSVLLFVSCHFVCNLQSPHGIYLHIYFSFCSTQKLPVSVSFLPPCYLIVVCFFLFAVSFFLFFSDHHHYTPTSSLFSCRSLLPFILQMLVAEQYPRGHDDWLPPRHCGLFLLLSLVLLLLGSYTQSIAHIMA